MPKEKSKRPKPLSSDLALKPYAREMRELEWFFHHSYVGLESNCLTDSQPNEPPMSLRAVRKHRKILAALCQICPQDLRILCAALDYYDWHKHQQLENAFGRWIGVCILLCDAPEPLRHLPQLIVRNQKDQIQQLIGKSRSLILEALQAYQVALYRSSKQLDAYL